MIGMKLLNWVIGSELEWKSLKAVLCKLVLSAIVYNIWRERNNVKHGNQLLTEERIMMKIIWEVRTRVLSKGCFKKSKENEELCVKWDFWIL